VRTVLKKNKETHGGGEKRLKEREVEDERGKGDEVRTGRDYKGPKHREKIAEGKEKKKQNKITKSRPEKAKRVVK